MELLWDLQIDRESEISKFMHFLKHSQKIVLINHRRMDGDCFGSLSAFYYLLKKHGYDVVCTNDEGTPEVFTFLNEEEIFTPKMDLNSMQVDLLISFDVASKEQLGDMYKNNQLFFHNTPFVNIDHHLSNDAFGSINIINTDASSTCEITWDIIKRLGWEKDIDSKIATFLLTGIITDTNSFFNTNSTSKALETASQIMRYQPRHQDIIINLFKKKPYHRLKLWWKILESLKDIKNWQIVWNIIPRSLFIQTGTTDKDISWLIDEFLTTIDGLKVWFILYELDDKKVKWSFRSKTDEINLSDFCSAWWGWGHSRASGFVIEWKNIYEVEQEVIEAFKKVAF